MRLSDKELKLIAEVEKRQSNRKKGAWLSLVAVILMSIAAFNGVQALKEQSILLGLFLGYAVMHLANVYFSVRPEDKLMELLQRYVNHDPEAVAQIAELAKADSRSADSRAAPTN